MENVNYITYNENELINRPLKWQKLGLQETSSGYGAKLTTTKMLKIGNRLYRVYCACYGNSGSAYIIKNGVKLWLRNY